MANQSLREVVLQVMSHGTPSAGYDLLGMEIDFTAYLSGLSEIDPDSVTATRTDDAEQLIRASCRAATGITLEDALRAVEEAWVSSLRYNYLEAHDLSVSEDGARLDFVTQIGPGGLYVTGRVQIDGALEPPIAGTTVE